MPRFYFDTSLRGQVHLDLEGEDYPDAPSAVQAAKFDEEKLIRAEDGKIIARFRALDMLGEVIPRR